MSNKSNNDGRAYEFICLKILEAEISKIRLVQIEENSSLAAAQKAWNLIDEDLQNTLKVSAKAATVALFDFEPLISEKEKDVLTLKLQPDTKGEEGDVRDILIIRSGIKWEIGLSLKHNHFAVKHSRLSKTIDFGQKWYGVTCSDDYWNAVNPIFNYLTVQKATGAAWHDLPNKENDVYITLLQAFKFEIEKAYKSDKSIPKRLVEYLLGAYDFYKIISVDSQRLTQLQSYNIHGTLNKSAKTQEPKILIPIVALPTRIVAFEFKENSTNTLELYLDGGWQFSFRIHNAATLVEPSLKFDIQIVGMPTTIFTINSYWIGE